MAWRPGRRARRSGVEDVGDEAEALLDEEAVIVRGDDAGRLLSAVLQRVQAELGELSGVVRPADAEDRALLTPLPPSLPPAGACAPIESAAGRAGRSRRRRTAAPPATRVGPAGPYAAGAANAAVSQQRRHGLGRLGRPGQGPHRPAPHLPPSAERMPAASSAWRAALAGAAVDADDVPDRSGSGFRRQVVEQAAAIAARIHEQVDERIHVSNAARRAIHAAASSGEASSAAISHRSARPTRAGASCPMSSWSACHRGPRRGIERTGVRPTSCRIPSAHRASTRCGVDTPRRHARPRNTPCPGPAAAIAAASPRARRAAIAPRAGQVERHVQRAGRRAPDAA